MRSLFSVLQRTAPAAWTLPVRSVRTSAPAWKVDSICTRCRLQQKRQFSKSRQLTESLLNVDHPAKLVRVNQKHGPGLIILALIPIIAFGLGTWQVQRLDRKTKMIAKFEDRLIRPPLPLPPRIDPDAIAEFDYRRVYATGHYRHDKEMLVGPRMYEGEDGFLVVTPLERGDGQSTVLVNRGWISRKLMAQKDRPDGLPQEEITVEGLLREPWKKNMFTPENKPEEGKFYFPDIKQMAELAGSQPVWIEETMVPDLIESYDRIAKGRPLGRAAEVNLRNNHAQYIFTWYGLSLATSIMLWMVVRKKPNDALRRVRQNRNWS
ncbi:Cytochrome oxidase assembly protein shy1 [Penicillium daleae]|uniref:SURF1-like protein n=1 Tax=Penicillium daleae TaxID=63821 RepID=A0AAD6CBC9_9EURO|nr:Cytochrome oxidase assembly protein shy1 [Penicillium daleae]KAJ5460140.1 Cytochrome oxidase assembly protein shy1 [Penicillium daleae]